ncbi:MAG TPA: choice-of-anchor Q domain-containing protein [Phycisphaerae bacterium]|nr:choice-of-anchor Q domain-containing protein [Phycisphaerae bacterium]
MARYVICFAAFVVATGGICADVRAATFVVTTTIDAPDANLGDGACAIAGGGCSLRAAIQQANVLPGAPHEIVLPAGLFQLSPLGVDGINGDLHILERMTIRGAGRDATIIDGMGTDRVFHIYPPVMTLALRDMTVRNGHPADGLPGGGVYYPGGGELVVERVRFAGHSSNTGGAVSLDGVSMTVADCTFENNTSAGPGAGIYHSGVGFLNVSNSSFSFQTATGGPGGAICYYSAGNQLTIVGGAFSNCTGNPAGAVNCVTNGPLSVSGATFQSNQATFDAGGAIFYSGSGGATFSGCTVVGNSSLGIGGGCMINCPAGGNLSVSDSHIQDNTSNSYGGGLYFAGAAGSAVTIQNTDLTRNKSLGANGGGGMYAGHGGPLTLTNISVVDNSSGGGGGGLYASGHALATVSNSRFTGNTTAGAGGGAWYDSGSGGGLITNTTFSGNTVQNSGFGGALVWNAGGLSVTGCTFSLNGATGAAATGGAIYYAAAAPAVASLTNCTFGGNSAGQFGGAVYKSGGIMNFLNCTLAGNSAAAAGGSGGGAIFPAGGIVTVTNTILANSLAGGNCGLPVTSGGNNIDSGSTCALGAGESNINPLLGPLADNGGGRLTYALLVGSPAIDAGGAAGCATLTTDERGAPRSLDGNGDGVAVCDIGAFEFSDCNRNGIDDTSEVTATPGLDCNHNGVPDACDIARGVLSDADHDGIPDICDTCTDTDGDGFGDPGFPANTCPVDNCPNTPNPDQADSNHDGVGDVCAAGPAAAAGPCGVCGLGVGMMMPLMLLALGWMKRHGPRP